MRTRVVAALLTLLVCSRARADEAAQGPPPEAKKAFLDGKAAFERGDYESALRLFQRASLIAPAPSLYYNIGMAYERLGRYEDSAIAFEKYLQIIDPPTNDEERSFQANLRARAAANRDKGLHPGTQPAPSAPLVEPSPQGPVGAARYPVYYYQPYAAPLPAPPPPLTHRQKIDIARRHRNNGIALVVVGGVLLGAGVGATAWAATTSRFNGDSLTRGLVLWGTISPILIGVTLFIPGAVALAKWQGELNAELKRPDDGAGAAKAALESMSPMRSPGGDRTLVLGAPAIHF
jgi:tetratricopeptide (TPR) repeat protein